MQNLIDDKNNINSEGAYSAQLSLLSSTPTPQPLTPAINGDIDPQIQKDLQAWLEAEMQLDLDRKELQKLAAMLHTMKNPMLGVQEVMMMMMNVNGDQIGGLSAISNIDSDMRSELSNASSAFNDAANGTGNSPQTQADCAKLVQIISQLEAFLKQQQGEGSNSVLDPADINNLQTAIGNIKNAFGDKDWGQPIAMANDIYEWVTAQAKGGNYSPELKSVQDAFNTINQSTSALSTTTNTQLQFTTEQFKQYMGIDEDANQAYLKFITTSVNNERSN